MDYLAVAKKAALEAEKIILNYFEKQKEVAIKADQSPVSIADRQAEEVIIKIIKQHFPDHAILGEESGGKINSSNYTWIIDPIDGTKNYLRGLPYFATQIALVKEDEFLMGVSHAPLLQETFYAQKGNGAFRNDQQIFVSQVADISQSFMTFGGLKYFEKLHKTQGIINLSKDVLASRGYGDFLGYHFLAQGKVDFFMDLGCYIWDIAAVIPIVLEAGGKISDIEGKQLTMESKSIVASNGLLHTSVLNYFK